MIPAAIGRLNAINTPLTHVATGTKNADSSNVLPRTEILLCVLLSSGEERLQTIPDTKLVNPLFVR